MQIAGVNDAGHLEGEQCLVAFCSFFFIEGFEEESLGIANRLDALKGEVSCEAGQHQAWPVDGRLANRAFKAAGASYQVQFKRAGVLSIEAFDSYEITLHGKNPTLLISLVPLLLLIS